MRLTQAIDLADKFGIYAYDGYVLDCAKQYRTPLLSLDTKMVDIARLLQIHILEIEK
ncbi:MAG: hypothetical protein WD529_08135 [Balneolaceae bacterium]